MKRLTAYVTFTSVTILVLCAGTKYGGCPSGMIRVGLLCYKWYDSAVSVTEAIGTCTNEGGHLAGFENGNFLEIINESPLLEEYLGEKNWFWAIFPPRTSRLSWVKPVVPDFLIEGMRMFFHVSTHSKMCYKKSRWVVEFVSTERRVNFVCEHEVSLFEEDRRRRDVRKVKISVVYMEKKSTFVADQPLFEEGTPVPTMCSRLCQEFTGCSIFNYNTLTKQCRGFGKMEVWNIHYHKDWGVWVFK